MRTELVLALTCSVGTTAAGMPAGGVPAVGGARGLGAAAAVNTGIPVASGHYILVERTTAAFEHGTTGTFHVFDLDRSASADTGLGQALLLDLSLHHGLVFAGASEAALGDLNGDGDAGDEVLAAFEIATDTLAYFSAVPEHFPFNPHSQLVSFADDVVALETSEASEGGVDRNGDGDATDVVIETLLLRERNALGSLGATARGLIPRALRGSALPSTGCCAGPLQAVDSRFRLDGERLYVGVNERSLGAGVDLNGDGDTLDARVLHVLDHERGRSRNLGVNVEVLEIFEGQACASVREAFQGEDLNGDGDLLDLVFHHWNPETGTLVNTGIAVGPFRFFELVAGHWLLFRPEQGSGQDFNGDGDLSDSVPHVYDPEAATLESLGTTVRSIAGFGTRLLLSVDEDSEGATDLNGDGDAFDTVLHMHDLASGSTVNLTTALQKSLPLVQGDRLIPLIVSEPDQSSDFNFDGDASDLVLGVYDGLTGTFTNTALALYAGTALTSGSTLAFRVDEAAQGGADLNGDGDADDDLVYLYDADTKLSVSTGLTQDDGFTFRGALGPDMLFFLVNEEKQGSDLDGDGAQSHDVAYTVDLRAR